MLSSEQVVGPYGVAKAIQLGLEYDPSRRSARDILTWRSPRCSRACVLASTTCIERARGRRPRCAPRGQRFRRHGKRRGLRARRTSADPRIFELIQKPAPQVLPAAPCSRPAWLHREGLGRGTCGDVSDAGAAVPLSFTIAAATGAGRARAGTSPARPAPTRAPPRQASGPRRAPPPPSRRRAARQLGRVRLPRGLANQSSLRETLTIEQSRQLTAGAHSTNQKGQ